MDAKQLARVHRVRTLQLGLRRADEVQAQARLEGEEQLAARIAELAAATMPTLAGASAASLLAAAHFRERLHVSAVAADGRRHAARAVVDRAAEATRVARRDQSAVEKLLARAAETSAAAERRAAEEAPPAGRTADRHDPC